MTTSPVPDAPGPPLLVRRAELDGRRLVDVRIAGGLVTEVSSQPLRPSPRETVIDAAGGALLPGLHDHHLHLMSLAAAASSVAVGPSDVHNRAGFAAALRDAPGAASDWVRAIGYHPAVAGDLDRQALDALLPDRPVRLQYRTGSLWVLNSRALDRAGVDGCDRPGVERDAAGRPTGRLWRMDDWLRAAVPPVAVDLAALGRAAAAAGVTGFTDATPARSPAEAATLMGASTTGSLPQRLTLMRPEGGGDPGRPPSAPSRVGWGPVKIMLDDTTLPAPDALAARIRLAHRAGHPVAVHCVTRVQLVVTVAALADAGPHRSPGAGGPDRIEHGAVVPPELRPALRALGAVVVTQPNFIAERGDRYLADVKDEDPATLYPAASLLDAGIGLAGGTDAPFGGPDPWAAVAAAVDRRTATGRVVGPAERLSAGRALDLFLGAAVAPHRPRVVRPGATADLCLLRLPRDVALREPAAGNVAATVIGGRIVSGADTVGRPN
ncbi:MAG: amidohydrolase family protein [Frankia sp.]